MRAIALVLLLSAASGAAHAQAPIANVGPRVIDFGDVRVGQRIPTVVTVRNLTTSPFTFAGGGVIQPSPFSGSTGTCTGGLAAGATCQFQYEFRPQEASDEEVVGAATIRITVNGSQRAFPIELRGRGHGRVVNWPIEMIDFGDVFLGETVSFEYQLHNPTDLTANFAGGGFSGPGFSSSTSCGGGLAPGASCTKLITFTPTTLGLAEGSTTNLTGLAGTPIGQKTSMRARGRGVNVLPPLASIGPVAVDFGPQKIGWRTRVPVSFMNLTGSNVNLLGGNFANQNPGTGSDGGAFSAQGGGGDCNLGVMPPNGECFFNYYFRPREVRDHAGMASLAFAQPPGTVQDQPLQFAGSAVGYLARVSPVAIDFGPVRYATTIASQVTVFNDGDLPLDGFVGGNVTPPFSANSTCDDGPVPVGGSCTITYTYNASVPLGMGAHETTTLLSFTNSTSLRQTVEIRLAGTGIDTLFRHSFENGAN